MLWTVLECLSTLKFEGKFAPMTKVPSKNNGEESKVEKGGGGIISTIVYKLCI